MVWLVMEQSQNICNAYDVFALIIGPYHYIYDHNWEDDICLQTKGIQTQHDLIVLSGYWIHIITIHKECVVMMKNGLSTNRPP